MHANHLRLAVLAFLPLVLMACGGRQTVAASDRCREQIVLSLSPGVSRTDRVIEGLEKTAGVSLEYLRSVSPNLFVYTLSSKARDPGCSRALARLREDSHVRFAEPDARRAPHGFSR